MTGESDIDKAALLRTLAAARRRLLAARTPAGHWVGELSSSALSTATASFALHRADRQRFAPQVASALRWLVEHQNADGGWGDTTDSPSNIATTLLCWAAMTAGDAKQETAPNAKQESPVLGKCERWLVAKAGSLKPDDLVAALTRRYGDDRTFSVPILMMCALAGRLGPADRAWRHVAQLPFELAACPHAWLKFLRLPVVSYALPALIAIGQARHHFRPTGNPLARLIRNGLRKRTLAKLAAIQPASGGFLEAAPLTSFVVMCLAAIGDCPDDASRERKLAGAWQDPNAAQVIARGAEFLASTARPDGSWPIDTNLSVWVTTLSIKALAAGGALGEFLPPAERDYLLNWLIERQYRVEHPYTHAAPGGWAWTDLSGGVPDADDTAGALLAIRALVDAGTTVGDERSVQPECAAVGYASPSGRGRPAEGGAGEGFSASRLPRKPSPGPEGPPSPKGRGVPEEEVLAAATAGVRWLTDLQNRDGGIPTFCRGWGKLPFDRSGPDLTAHALAAWNAWSDLLPKDLGNPERTPVGNASGYLVKNQHRDGSWAPLWFGNQAAPDEKNRTYGTARILLWRPCICEANNAEWLLRAQGRDGGWGGGPGIAPTIEETAVAVEALQSWLEDFERDPQGSDIEPTEEVKAEMARVFGSDYEWDYPQRIAGEIPPAIARGVRWLIEHTKGGTEFPAAPIGLYFARLWYSEKLYPLIFTVSALGRAAKALCP